jgi:hypothetical protein
MLFRFDRRWLAALVALSGMALACSGDLDTLPDEASEGEWVPGSFTYSQLVRTSQVHAQGKHLVEPGEGSLDVEPDSANVRIRAEVDVDIVTESRDQLGDLDLAADAIGRRRGALLVTLEVANGPVLASASLSDDKVVSKEQLARAGVLHNAIKKLTVEIPSELAEPGSTFDAALLACIDTNKNGACGDEIVNRLDQAKEAQHVIFYAAIEGVVEGEGSAKRVSFQPPSGPEFGIADKVMVNVLKNLPAEDGGNALTVKLAVGSLGEQGAQLARNSEYVSVEQLGDIRQEMKRLEAAAARNARRQMHRSRTNGCFVAGTRIILKDGGTRLVQQVFSGTKIHTAQGALVTVKDSVAGPEKHPVVRIETDAGHQISVTRSHPMLTPAGLRLAGELELGDKLVAADRSEVAITKLTPIEYNGLVYNFVLPGTGQQAHLVNAEGLLTGDLYLQQKLSK